MTRIGLAALLVLLWTAGCASLAFRETYRPLPPGPHGWDALVRDPDLARRILALDPERITPEDIARTLSKGPTPWLMGIAPLPPWAVEFLNLIQFFVKSGYPPGRIGDPRINDYRINWREKPEVIGGMAAWFYENDGMAPILIGWSGGGILVVHVLHTLNGSLDTEKVRMVNARTGKIEERTWFRDFHTGESRPMRELRIPFAAALAAGGLGRYVQSKVWPIVQGLHRIPDTVQEFLGFKAPLDIFGTDMLNGSDAGFIEANRFQPMGTARVRSIMTDDSYEHFWVVHCNELLDDPQGTVWIQNYRPDPGYGQRDYRSTRAFSFVEGKRNLFCGELWHGVKKHWALSAQRVARTFLERREATSRWSYR